VAELGLVRRMNTRSLVAISTMIVADLLNADGQSVSVRPHEPLPPSWQIHRNGSIRFDTPPEVIRSAAPIYPATQWLQPKSGNAVIEFTIDERGDTRDFKVISADYPYYASHPIHAVREWKFQPGLKNGHPVAVRVRVPFHYGFR
jgi:TonB family protein